MTNLKVKAGSIILIKDYNFFKKYYYKLINKELPYNYYIIVDVDKSILISYNDYLILEPRKPYNKKEKQLLTYYIVLNYGYEASNDIEELIVIVNSVRSNTITSDTKSISDLIKNKYFKIKYDSKR